MDWDAVFVIGMITAILGGLLYIPARIWIRRSNATHSGRNVKLRLTRTGWVSVVVMPIILFGGFSAQYVAPASAVGQLVTTSRGRFLYLIIVIVIFWFVEVGLKALGKNLIEEDDPPRLG
jgi:hypothetical protein